MGVGTWVNCAWNRIGEEMDRLFGDGEEINGSDGCLGIVSRCWE